MNTRLFYQQGKKIMKHLQEKLGSRVWDVKELWKIIGGRKHRTQKDKPLTCS